MNHNQSIIDRASSEVECTDAPVISWLKPAGAASGVGVGGGWGVCVWLVLVNDAVLN